MIYYRSQNKKEVLQMMNFKLLFNGIGGIKRLFTKNRKTLSNPPPVFFSKTRTLRGNRTAK